MNIIYIHGLDSDANSIKGSLLEEYCRQYDPDINVLRPDLNKTPDQVFDQMLSLILSKALLLAADDQITDRSIVQQIQRV